MRLSIVYEATAAERKFRSEARRLVRAADTLQAESIRKIAKRTKLLRRQVLDGLGGVDSWTSFRLPALLEEIERATTAWAKSAGVTAAATAEQGAKLGAEVAEVFADAVAVPAVTATLVTPELVGALREISADLVVQVGEDTRRRIAREVRSAALGLQRPHEAMTQIGRMVKGVRVKIDGEHRFIGPMGRAESIVRTETNRAFSVAHHTQMVELSDRVPGLVKEWIATADSRTRESHAEAHGQIRKVSEPFNVGGALLMTPQDPAGPAREVVNCRCVDLEKMPEWSPAPRLSR